jgi:hypothetical protein
VPDAQRSATQGNQRIRNRKVMMNQCSDPPYMQTCNIERAKALPRPSLVIPEVLDIEPAYETGAAWDRTAWNAMHPLGVNPSTLETRFKMLRSDRGLHLLVDCEDTVITCSEPMRGGDLWLEDVIELFLWPDERHPIYFQYDVSPLGAELALLCVSANDQVNTGWQHWHDEGHRRTRVKTSVRGGIARPGAEVSGWAVECFIPFALLAGMPSVPPHAGSRWRGNVYRTDYVRGRPSHWAWCPRTSTSTHARSEYGVLLFGEEAARATSTHDG